MKTRIAWFAVAAIVAAGAAPSTFAQNARYLTVNTISYHLDRSREHNEQNPGLGIEHYLTRDFALVAGFYRNSRPTEDGTSTYGAIAYTPLVLGPVRLGFMVGAVTGYKAALVLPTYSGLISIGGRDEGVNIQILPSLRDRSPVGAFGLQLKRSF